MNNAKNLFGLLVAGWMVLAALFLVLVAPGLLKSSYVLFLYIAFFIGVAYAVIRRKEDFLSALFIISICFAAFNINVLKYAPSLGAFIPRLMPADLLLGALLVLRLAGLGLRRWLPVFSGTVNTAFLLLIGSVLFSYLFVSPGYAGFQENGFYELFSVVRGYLIFLFFYNYLESPEKYRVVVASFGFVVVMEFALMLYQWVTGDFLSLGSLVYSDLEGSRILEYGETRRAFGTFMYPSIAAGVVAVILPMTIAYTSSSPRTDRLLSAARYSVLFLGPGCILLSGARVPLIALVALIPVMLVLAAWRFGQRDFMKSMSRYLLTILTAGAVIGLVVPVFSHWAERFSRQDFLENSLDFRFLIYRMGARAFDAHPWLGVGWGNGDEYGHTLLYGGEGALYQFGLHNGYIRMLVEGGLVGLVLYLAWYFLLARASLRKLPYMNGSPQFTYLGGIPALLATQMLMVDTQGVLLRNEAEFMFFCLSLAFMRGFDDMKRVLALKPVWSEDRTAGWAAAFRPEFFVARTWEERASGAGYPAFPFQRGTVFRK